jgi:hypothetical protein
VILMDFGELWVNMDKRGTISDQTRWVWWCLYKSDSFSTLFHLMGSGCCLSQVPP